MYTKTNILTIINKKKETLKKLEKHNFKFITDKDFKIDPLEEKYKLPDGHPNEDFWNVLTPVVINKLNNK